MAEFDHRTTGDLASDPVHKKLALYLYGKRGSGKTMFIRLLLENHSDAKQIFHIPKVTKGAKFSYSNFNPEMIRVSWLDEFDYREVEMNSFKAFLAGETVTKEVKNLNSKTFVNHYPVIISSQESPMSDPAFQDKFGGRLFVICTDPENACNAHHTISPLMPYGTASSITALSRLKVTRQFQEPKHMTYEAYANLKSKSDSTLPICPTRVIGEEVDEKDLNYYTQKDFPTDPVAANTAPPTINKLILLLKNKSNI